MKKVIIGIFICLLFIMLLIFFFLRQDEKKEIIKVDTNDKTEKINIQKKKGSKEEQNKIIGIIIAINQEKVIVKDNQALEIHVDNINKLDIVGLKEGDRVVIYFMGGMQETLPARIMYPVKIKKLK